MRKNNNNNLKFNKKILNKKFNNNNNLLKKMLIKFNCSKIISWKLKNYKHLMKISNRYKIRKLWLIK